MKNKVKYIIVAIVLIVMLLTLVSCTILGTRNENNDNSSENIIKEIDLLDDDIEDVSMSIDEDFLEEEILDSEIEELTYGYNYKYNYTNYDNSNNKYVSNDSNSSIKDLAASISYSTNSLTYKTVVVTITSNRELETINGWTLSEDKKTLTKEYSSNTKEIVTIKDKDGITKDVEITIKNISSQDKEKIGTDGEFKYIVLDSGEIQLTRYIGSKTDLTIPANYDGYKVYAVGNPNSGGVTSSSQTYNIFSDTPNTPNTIIEKLTIENGIQAIGDGSFNKCTNLSGSLDLPNTLNYIGIAAFNNCSNLTGDLIIPESVTYIGDGAFQQCSGFNGKISLPNSLKEIRDYAFNKCSGLTGDLIIPEGVKVIGRFAFNKCSGLTGDLIIPEGVTYIGDGAFNHTDALSGKLVLPSTLVELGRTAFQSSGITGELKLPESLTKIEPYTFNGCKNLTGDLIIPDSVTEIGQMAFQQLTNMKGKLHLPKNLKSIGGWAFYDCKFTGELELPEGLEEMGEAVFGKNTGFENTKIIIPSTLKRIGIDSELNGEKLDYSTHDFYNFGATNEKFESFEVAPGNDYFIAVDGVLYSKDKKRLISYPRDKKDEKYEILEGVVSISEMSIASNMHLKTLVIPDSLSLTINQQYIRMPNCSPVSQGLYNYNAVENLEVKDTNTRYVSYDGVLYSKDMKQLIYISSGRTKEVIIPDGVDTILPGSTYKSQIGKKISKLYIPSSVTNIIDYTVNQLNQQPFTKLEVSTDNPAFTVLNNKLVRK